MGFVSGLRLGHLEFGALKVNLKRLTNKLGLRGQWNRMFLRRCGISERASYHNVGWSESMSLLHIRITPMFCSGRALKSRPDKDSSGSGQG